MASEVIGKLSGTMHGKPWQAVLTEDGWQCGDETVSVLLRQFEPESYQLRTAKECDPRHPAIAALCAAAAALNGTVSEVNREYTRDRQAEAIRAAQGGGSARAS